MESESLIAALVPHWISLKLGRWQMRFKTLVHQQSWTENVEWQWPAFDEKLLQVFNQVSDIDTIMQYVDSRSVCVQAGGACGVWPLRLAQLFSNVYTFEPYDVNYECLLHNTEGVYNIHPHNAVVANDAGPYLMNNDANEYNNAGAKYVVRATDGIPGMRIDDLRLEACDLIQLDVEGCELQALLGAQETIDRCRPTIVIEEKRLSHIGGDPARARNWLVGAFGYKQVAAIHRDVILKC